MIVRSCWIQPKHIIISQSSAVLFSMEKQADKESIHLAQNEACSSRVCHRVSSRQLRLPNRLLNVGGGASLIETASMLPGVTVCCLLVCLALPLAGIWTAIAPPTVAGIVSFAHPCSKSYTPCVANASYLGCQTEEVVDCQGAVSTFAREAHFGVAKKSATCLPGAIAQLASPFG